jgi:hypothetical protein
MLGIFAYHKNLVVFWRALKWKVLVHVMTILFILKPFGIFFCHLVYFMPILWSFGICIFSHCGMLYQKNLATLSFCVLYLLYRGHVIVFVLNQPGWLHHYLQYTLSHSAKQTRAIEASRLLT